MNFDDWSDYNKIDDYNVNHGCDPQHTYHIFAQKDGPEDPIKQLMIYVSDVEIPDPDSIPAGFFFVKHDTDLDPFDLDKGVSPPYKFLLYSRDAPYGE